MKVRAMEYDSLLFRLRVAKVTKDKNVFHVTFEWIPAEYMNVLLDALEISEGK